LLRLLAPTGLLLTEGVALLLWPSTTDVRLSLGLGHGAGLRFRRNRLGLDGGRSVWLPDRSADRSHSDRSGERRRDLCGLAAHEFFHGDLPVTVHVGRGMQARCLFQIGASGLGQFLHAQATRFVLVSGDEAFLVADGLLLRFWL